MESIKTILLRLIADHPNPNLARMSFDSKVPQFILWRFAKGHTQSLDVDHANLLYKHLTGKPLLPETEVGK